MEPSPQKQAPALAAVEETENITQSTTALTRLSLGKPLLLFRASSGAGPSLKTGIASERDLKCGVGSPHRDADQIEPWFSTGCSGMASTSFRRFCSGLR